jgi:DMSO/TMAO reductase YedYZ molybdopterin-dependent catalytic subunit
MEKNQNISEGYDHILGFPNELGFIDTKDMIVNAPKPLNCEPYSHKLLENFITPRKYFFKRNHGYVKILSVLTLNRPIPLIDESTFTVEIMGLVQHSLKFTMKELKENFKFYRIHSTMMVAQCN